MRGGRTPQGRYAAYVLQICQDIFTDTILIEFGLNAPNHIINDGAINGRLI
jgi:hypothetical protein